MADRQRARHDHALTLTATQLVRIAFGETCRSPTNSSNSAISVSTLLPASVPWTRYVSATSFGPSSGDEARQQGPETPSAPPVCRLGRSPHSGGESFAIQQVVPQSIRPHRAEPGAGSISPNRSPRRPPVFRPAGRSNVIWSSTVFHRRRVARSTRESEIAWSGFRQRSSGASHVLTAPSLSQHSSMTFSVTGW